MKAVLRSLISAVIAGSFALSALTLGSTPGCVGSGQTSSLHPPTAHHGTHTHAGLPSEQASGTTQCVIHLCCIQLAPLSPYTRVAERFTQPDRSPGFAAKSRVVEVLPSHILPYSNAPPSISA
jgi:hypothetical protein